MLKNDTYKENLNANIRDSLLQDIREVIEYKKNDITYGLLTGSFGIYNYRMQDINSFIFDEIAKKYRNNKDEFKKGISFIKENAHLYAPLIDHDKTKFSNLVHDDCYQELTEIIGMTPEEYLNSL
ncbi:MAG TPA: hypothetical protein LFV91_06380 [Rickettsia endosymbiont of Bembidion nr. Transversale]|nr:hypothetical protein [Rickettsia endosymbiont of Stiretrus anchorago]HJD66633.1 hypothetical protein [Rickettsia endosymbiont of Bembidion nr. Transversale]